MLSIRRLLTRIALLYLDVFDSEYINKVGKGPFTLITRRTLKTAYTSSGLSIIKTLTKGLTSQI